MGLAFVSAAGSVQASEGGNHNFSIGSQTVVPAIMPPPGFTEFYSYQLWYNIRSIRDNSGASEIPEFRTDFLGHAGRIIHTWNTAVFGDNVHVGSGVIYLADYAKVKVGPTRDEDADFSLVNIQPVLFSGKVRDVYWYTGIHLFYGVGHYDPTHVANTVTHYAHYPTAVSDNALTWIPTPRLDASINVSVSDNMMNHHTGYHSGSLVGVEWGVDYHPFVGLPKLSVGANGFYKQQFTDDTLHGIKLPDTELVSEGAGPQFGWWFSPTAVVILKWQRQFHVHNGPSGDLIWIEFAVPLNIPGLGGSPSPPGGAPAVAPKHIQLRA